MKRLSVLLLCALITFSIAACSKSSGEETTPFSSSETTEQIELEENTSETTSAVVEEDNTQENYSDETVPQETKSAETASAENKPQPTEPKPTASSHSHNHVREEIKATCEQDGLVRYICSCGDVSSETKLPKSGHYWTSASCAAPKTCYYCGATEGTALPHSWIEATYSRPKTCQNCKTTEGSALAAPTISVQDSFPKDYYYYSRSFTVDSCQATFSTDSLGTARYIKITMNATRNSDSTPTAGKLAFKVNVYDANGTLIKQDSIWSDNLAHGTTGLMTASISLPKSSDSNSYSITFVESY